jgi:hypothetical protein
LQIRLPHETQGAHSRAQQADAQEKNVFAQVRTKQQSHDQLALAMEPMIAFSAPSARIVSVSGAWNFQSQDRLPRWA